MLWISCSVSGGATILEVQSFVLPLLVVDDLEIVVFALILIGNAEYFRSASSVGFFSIFFLIF